MDGAFDDENENENENEQTITINEYLDKVEEEELEADLVLGGDEGKECTYNSGYMKRQAIFSCLTCTPEGNAGVCTACSLSCHDGHEIVELWTKRNFRCDCGNSKFGEFFCKLFPQKEVNNGNNAYNHNFKGLYCTCGRPYPDPDVQDQEEMIQCIVCEDWFHEEHMGLESSKEVPKDEEGEPLYEDFICKTCSADFSFLTLYPPNIWAATARSNNDVTANSSKYKNVVEDIVSATGSGKKEKDKDDNSTDNPIGESSAMNISSEDANLQTTCVLGVDKLSSLPVLEGKPMFLSKNWREVLCRCENCLDMYNNKKISYLVDKEDSIAEYEKIAKQKREENLQKQEGAEMNFFNNLGHVEKIEILNGIKDFKDEFRTFLESFDTSKTVTSSDVQQIFENLAKKRRRD